MQPAPLPERAFFCARDPYNQVMSDSARRDVIQAAVESFEYQKRFAERAIAQVSDDQLHEVIGHDANSIAVIVKHMAGNMRSRWTDFLTTDGEKPDRNRDDEFIDTLDTREDMLAAWERGWRTVFDALRELTDADLGREIVIRGKPHTVIRAITRQVDHYGYHTGQIVLIAKLLAREAWQPITVPRGQSQQYNDKVWQRK